MPAFIVAILIALLPTLATAQTPDLDRLPTRQNFDEQVELSLGTSLVNFEDRSFSGGGLGFDAHGRLILNDRLTANASAHSSYDIGGGLIEAFVNGFFNTLFGLDDGSGRTDRDYDLMTVTADYQLNAPTSRTAWLAVAGVARGDAIGGPTRDTFQNDLVAGAGFDSRVSDGAEIRGRLRYIGIEDIGPELTLTAMTTGAFILRLDFSYTENVQLLGAGLGLRF
ncbi:MAG: hypothetical protein AAFQ36_06955 [Pseudomonadota bacterium]